MCRKIYDEKNNITVRGSLYEGIFISKHTKIQVSSNYF